MNKITPTIELRKVSKSFKQGTQTLEVLKEVDLEIMPEDFLSGSTYEDFEQYNKRRQEFYKFFSSKQPKFFLILRKTDNYYLDSYFMNEIRSAGAV